jgi:hypothetical protein
MDKQVIWTKISPYCFEKVTRASQAMGLIRVRKCEQ